MMFKRTVADDIGLTDEGPQREECVPDEWCLRSIYSGFQNLIAGDVLVYRSGNGRRRTGDLLWRNRGEETE